MTFVTLVEGYYPIEFLLFYALMFFFYFYKIRNIGLRNVELPLQTYNI
jgi:hypothetical protein